MGTNHSYYICNFILRVGITLRYKHVIFSLTCAHISIVLVRDSFCEQNPSKRNESETFSVPGKPLKNDGIFNFSETIWWSCWYDVIRIHIWKKIPTYIVSLSSPKNAAMHLDDRVTGSSWLYGFLSKKFQLNIIVGLFPWRMTFRICRIFPCMLEWCYWKTFFL